MEREGDAMTTYKITTFKVSLVVSEDIPKETSSPKESVGFQTA
jgi:hypothetical protein